MRSGRSLNDFPETQRMIAAILSRCETDEQWQEAFILMLDAQEGYVELVGAVIADEFPERLEDITVGWRCGRR